MEVVNPECKKGEVEKHALIFAAEKGHITPPSWSISFEKIPSKDKKNGLLREEDTLTLHSAVHHRRGVNRKL